MTAVDDILAELPRLSRPREEHHRSPAWGFSRLRSLVENPRATQAAMDAGWPEKEPSAVMQMGALADDLVCSGVSEQEALSRWVVLPGYRGNEKEYKEKKKGAIEDGKGSLSEADFSAVCAAVSALRDPGTPMAERAHEIIYGGPGLYQWDYEVEAAGGLPPLKALPDRVRKVDATTIGTVSLKGTGMGIDQWARYASGAWYDAQEALYQSLLVDAVWKTPTFLGLNEDIEISFQWDYVVLCWDGPSVWTLPASSRWMRTGAGKLSKALGLLRDLQPAKVWGDPREFSDEPFELVPTRWDEDDYAYPGYGDE